MPYPDARNWLKAHTRLTQGDEAAWEEVAGYFLPWLCQILVHRRPDVDDQLIAESVEDALLDYRKGPNRFDASRGVFLGYWLLIQARGHLSHLLRREKRRRAKEWAIGVTDKIFERFLSETHFEMAMYQGGGEDENEQQKRILDNLLPRLGPHERVAVDLLSVKAPFEQWVEQLNIANLPTNEQRDRVNAERSRIKKKLRRLVQRWKRF